MRFNFRKRKKVLPGVYLNFSKKGISANIGRKGANVSIGSKGTHLNFGIPGSGIYTRRKLKSKRKLGRENKTKTATIILALFLGSFGVHRFYLRQNIKGLLYLIFCWSFVPTIISFIDALCFYFMNKNEFDEKYNAR